MKYKEYHFDVEMIIDHEIKLIRGKVVKISTHRTMRNFSLQQLCSLVRENQVPNECNSSITLNIRAVTD